MPKNPVSARRSRRLVSRAPQDSGLIANAETLKRSAGTKSALDNRSHRTPKFAANESNRSVCEARAILSSFVSCNVR